MDLMALTEFTWNALASGVAYDTLKTTLGNGFERLTGYRKEEQRDKFDTALIAILETNDEIRSQLANLASGGNNTTITTGNIDADGNVIVGNNNKMG